MVLKSGHITPAFAKEHYQEMLAYAQGLTPEEAVSNPPLVERLYESGNKAALPLFEKWLPAVKDRYVRSYYEDAIRDFRKPNQN
jgi:hypothetical protein